MNREQTIEAIRVMQAWVDGEVVQCYWADEWHDMSHYDMNWLLLTNAYRIKPKPMRKYVVECPDGFCHAYNSIEDAATEWATGPFALAKWHGWMVEETK